MQLLTYFEERKNPRVVLFFPGTPSLQTGSSFFSTIHSEKKVKMKCKIVELQEEGQNFANILA
jgi:hypothetical protein